MSKKNPQTRMLEAFAKISTGVAEGRLDPLLLAQDLEYIAQGKRLPPKLPGMIRATKLFLTSLEKCAETVPLPPNPLFEKKGKKILLEASITEMRLSTRVENALDYQEIKTVGELVQRTPEELLSFRNFAEQSLQEVVEKLTELGLTLSKEEKT